MSAYTFVMLGCLFGLQSRTTVCLHNCHVWLFVCTTVKNDCLLTLLSCLVASLDYSLEFLSAYTTVMFGCSLDYSLE